MKNIVCYNIQKEKTFFFSSNKQVTNTFYNFITFKRHDNLSYNKIESLVQSPRHDSVDNKYRITFRTIVTGRIWT